MSNPGDTIPDGPGSVGVQPQPKDERVVRGQTAEINRPPATNGGKGGPAYIAEQLWPLAVPIDTLTPDPANARKHGEKNMAAIRASLSRFGQRAPIVVQRQGMVIRAGNGRWLAAKAMGWTQIAAVVVDDSSIDAVAFAIADNRTAELAEWDTEVLTSLLDTMGEDDLGVTGFDRADLDGLLDELRPDVVEDTVPEAKPNPVSKTGDLWLLGDHRLLCGDSTSADDVKRLMDGQLGAVIATDPPYGVDFKGAKYCPTAKTWDAIANDTRTGSDLTAWLVSMWSVWLKHVRDDASFYSWCAAMEEGAAAAAMREAGIHVQSQIIWVKNSLVLGQADYQWKHENCWYGFFKGKQHRWFGERDKTTVWDISKVASSSYVHPMQKPIEIYAIPMKHHTLAGDVVCEPFSGSGSQFIAAEQLGRKCYGMEISPQYCDVIVRRWEQLTSKKATCDGKTIEQLAEERGVV